MDPHVSLLAASASGQIEEIARTFGVDWVHLGAQIISFSIVCAVLHRFAYRPVLAALEQRRKSIAEGLEAAEKMKAELASADVQCQERLRQAEVQAGKLIEEARAAAARVRDRETRRATAEAEQIVAKAHEEATRDRDRIFRELQQEVGHLVIHTTAAVAGRVLNAEDQQRLAEETVKYVAA